MGFNGPKVMYLPISNNLASVGFSIKGDWVGDGHVLSNAVDGVEHLVNMRCLEEGDIIAVGPVKLITISILSHIPWLYSVSVSVGIWIAVSRPIYSCDQLLSVVESDNELKPINSIVAHIVSFIIIEPADVIVLAIVGEISADCTIETVQTNCHQQKL